MKVQEEFKGADIVFLKVSIEAREKELEAYKKEFNVKSPILMDELFSTADSYGVWSHPATFFIGRNGKVLGRALRGLDWTSPKTKALLHYLLEGKK